MRDISKEEASKIGVEYLRERYAPVIWSISDTFPHLNSYYGVDPHSYGNCWFITYFENHSSHMLDGPVCVLCISKETGIVVGSIYGHG